jgi:hypothetical protein
MSQINSPDKTLHRILRHLGLAWRFLEQQGWLPITMATKGNRYLASLELDQMSQRSFTEPNLIL